MRKIFILSFDDGTVYDERFVELLNKYDIPCTFNLNTGLEDFTWYYGNTHPIRRLCLEEKKHIYDGHEIASHSRTHPLLTALRAPVLTAEVREDCARLREIFGDRELGFGVPFTACEEREIHLIRKFVRYIRLSEFQNSFELPPDPYHIRINGLYNDPDIRERIEAFSQSPLPVSLFVLCGHSYEFEVLDQWEYMEDLLNYIKSFHFEIMTTIEFVNTVLDPQ